MVKGLDTKARRTVLAQRSSVGRREKNISVEIQSRLARLLDESAESLDHSDDDVEGLTALALMLQCGMRPVQLISLRLEHVQIYQDASNETVGVVSFHAAKQREGNAFELPRQVKQEWVHLLIQLVSIARSASRSRLFGAETSERLWNKVRGALVRRGHAINFTANALRHTAAQSLADAGHGRAGIQKFLGHSTENAATVYMKASLQQSEILNEALGASKLYDTVLAFASRKFVSVRDVLAASEDLQIGAIVGDRLIAGIGLCGTGQASCVYNPVTSCYGCKRFMPSVDRRSHEDAVAGMREQVLKYVDGDGVAEGSAVRQLRQALSGAQQALEFIDRISRGEVV